MAWSYLFDVWQLDAVPWVLFAVWHFGRQDAVLVFYVPLNFISMSTNFWFCCCLFLFCFRNGTCFTVCYPRGRLICMRVVNTQFEVFRIDSTTLLAKAVEMPAKSNSDEISHAMQLPPASFICSGSCSNKSGLRASTICTCFPYH